LNRKRRTLIATALALGCPTLAFGQEAGPLVTDRPTFSAAPFTVAPGRFQFEMGYTFTKSGDDDRHNFGEVLARIGILPWLEGRVGLNSFVLVRSPAADVSGLQDLAVAAKAVIFRRPEGSSAAVPQVALMAGADMPTGTSDVAANEVQPGARVLVDFKLTDRLVIGSNVGWTYLASDGEWFSQWSASLGGGYSISNSVSAFLEWYGLYPENRGGGASDYLDGGLTWLLKRNLQIDWRIGVGLQEPDPNWFMGVGVSFRL